MAQPSIVRDCVLVPGFKDLQSLLVHLERRLTADGKFAKVFPAGSYDGTTKLVLEPTNLVDPLRGQENDTPTWRICFDINVEQQTVTTNIATAIQIQDDGTIAKASWLNEPINPGQLNNFIDRRHIKEPLASAVYPMTYALTVTDHGIFLAIWDQAFDERQDEINFLSPALRWILIQRPVDNKTGAPVTTGKAPVYCVYTILGSGTIPTSTPIKQKLFDKAIDGESFRSNVGGSAYVVQTKENRETLYWKPFLTEDEASAQFFGYRPTLVINPVTWDGDPNSVYHWPVHHQVANSVQIHHRFVVCEADINRPSLTIPADRTTEDGNAIFNSHRQVATSEDNKYVITIPKGLNTTRYAYTHELDMMGYTSADVIGEGTEVDLPLYGGEYKFRALAANRQRNTGMRILYRINNELDPTPEPTDGPMDVGVSDTGNYGTVTGVGGGD